MTVAYIFVADHHPFEKRLKRISYQKKKATAIGINTGTQTVT